MKKGKLKIVLMLACCFALSVSLIACAPKVNTGDVSGKVVSGGEALSGVTVSIGDNTAETDEDGEYILTGVEVKDSVVKFSKTGYVSTEANVTAAEFGAEAPFKAEVADMVMFQEVSITGTISSIGKALDGASVVVTNSSEQQVAALTTDANGKFNVEKLPIDSYTVRVSKTGYGENSKKLTTNNFRSGVATVTLSLVKYGSVTGKVLGGDGLGLEGVTVKFGDKVGTTAADGSYTLENVEVGAASLTFTKAGYIAANKSLTLVDFNNAEAKATIADVTMKSEVLPGLGGEVLDELGASVGRSFRHTTAFKEGWKHQGNVNEHSEGYCLHANGDTASQQFAGYVYAKFNLTKGVDDQLFVSARTFADQGSRYGTLGLMVVVDGESSFVKAEGEAENYVKIDSDGYMTVHFDLSGLFGAEETKKTVVIALGTNQGTHCAIDQVKLCGGTMALPFLTKEDLAGEALQTAKTFTGKDVYNTWAHIGGTAALTEGSSIWNRTIDNDGTTTDADMNAFFYANFAITADNAKMALKAMTFEDQLTETGDHMAPTMYVKVVKSDGTVATIGVGQKITSKTAAEFTYDLSAYVGETVTIAIGTASGWHCVLTSVAFNAATAA